MKRWFAVGSFVVLAVSGNVRPLAHHDFAATYDARSSVTLDAQLVRLSLRNPHSFMQVEVRDGGADVRYDVEWSGVDRLRRSGIDAMTLRSGDRVILTGRPGKIPSNRRLRLTTLRRPKDGLHWSEPMG
jgi:hypothetical protein